MARKNVEVCIYAMRDGKCRKAPRSVSTDGRVLYSYAMPIAVDMGAWVALVDGGPSITTTQHISSAWSVFARLGYEVVRFPADEVRGFARDDISTRGMTLEQAKERIVDIENEKRARAEAHKYARQPQRDMLMEAKS